MFYICSFVNLKVYVLFPFVVLAGTVVIYLELKPVSGE